MAGRLSPQEIASGLSRVPRWGLRDGALHREFCFPDFRAAIAFVIQVADLAERADHHPDIDIRYDRVACTLTTHSAGGLTARDFALAAALDALPSPPGPAAL